MLVAFIAFSFLMGLFFFIIWTSSTMLNVLIKTALGVYTLIAAAMLLGVLAPLVAGAGMILF
jgi:hypothetical protein